MAMSADEKASNKAAQKVRDRAHTARYRQLGAAVEAAENSPEVREAENAYRFADAEMTAAVEARNAKVDDLRHQIEALQEQIRQLERSETIEALVVTRRAKADAWRLLKQAKVAQAHKAFPDMEGRAQFSAAAWNPPADVVVAMEAARAAV